MSVTQVPDTFIDNYMTKANGEYVKIYLYLLRHLTGDGARLSIPAMAESLDHTQLDIRRALRYWEDHELLHLAYDEANELTEICLIEPASDSAPIGGIPSVRLTSAPAAPAAPVTALSPADDVYPMRHIATITPINPTPSYSPDEILSFRQDDNIRELLCVTEQYIGRPLGPTDINIVISWYEELGLSTDLIEYVVESCVERGHANIRYINKAALNLAESGVGTIEEAKASMKRHSDTYFAVMKAFGISGRNLTPAETAYIDRWKDEYSMPQDVIDEALSRTVLATGKPSFEYADSILRRWSEADVRTISDITPLDRKHSEQKTRPATVAVTSQGIKTQNRFKNFSERTYDMDDMERRLLKQQQ